MAPILSERPGTSQTGEGPQKKCHRTHHQESTCQRGGRIPAGPSVSPSPESDSTPYPERTKAFHGIAGQKPAVVGHLLRLEEDLHDAPGSLAIPELGKLALGPLPVGRPAPVAVDRV